MGSITNAPTGNRLVNDKLESMDHEERVNYIINTLLDIEWVWAHLREKFWAGPDWGWDSRLTGYFHLTCEFNTDLYKDRFVCVCGYTQLYNTPPGKEISIEDIGDRDIKSCVSCICPDCIKWIQNNPHQLREHNDKIEYIYGYNPTTDKRRASRSNS